MPDERRAPVGFTTRAGALLGALLSGCGARQVELDVPFEVGSRSAIVAVTAPSGAGEELLRIEAVRLDVGGGFPLVVARDPALPARVVVLAYAETLEGLSLQAGPLLPAAPGERSRVIPAPAFAVESAVADGVASPFVRTSSLGPALRAFRLPAPAEAPLAGCPIFRITPVALPLDDDANWVLPADGGGVVVGTDQGMFRVERDLRTSSIAFPADAGALWGSADGQGNAWLGSRGGGLWRAKLGRVLTDPELVSTAPGAVDLDWIAAGGPTELYTLSDVGPLRRFDGRAWTTLHEFPMIAGLPVGSVLREGPGKVRAVLSSSPNVVAIDGASKREEATGSADGISAIADLPGFGLVASSIALYQRAGDAWVKLPDSEHRFLVSVMMELDGGILLAGSRGFVAYYRKDRGLCPPMNLVAETVTAGARLGGGVLLVGESPPGGQRNQTITFFEKTGTL